MLVEQTLMTLTSSGLRDIPKFRLRTGTVEVWVQGNPTSLCTPVNVLFYCSFSIFCLHNFFYGGPICNYMYVHVHNIIEAQPGMALLVVDWVEFWYFGIVLTIRKL